MIDDETMRRGKAAFDKCFGGVLPVPDQVPPDTYPELNMKLMDGIWGDEAMSNCDKRLVVIGVLAGSGADISMFDLHCRAALRNKELTPTELNRAVNVILYYAGAPKASPIFMKLMQILAETKDGANA
jgi:alkylhydroperoxidase/carboxymuconolactone decarboxylase family protein YurZ